MNEKTQGELIPEADILPLNTIRVETVTSRLPVHRLSRQGKIKIELAEVNELGVLTLGWKVSYNSEHGQPGPLAYKIDTLIINRRIDESKRVPRMLRLGSLSEICRELDLADSGKNRADVKKALLQNASAFIEPNFKYTQSDGTEDTLDTGFSRYSVVLTGKKLPNGQKADCVYISLSDVYLKVIRGASTRPLDYDYLKSLPPAAQRFYEILSFKMYGTLMNDRPRAKLIYSDCCARGPQKRHLTTKVMKIQMNRIHKIHQDSGYISDVVYNEFVDKDGLPDWEMLYKPGQKARSEFRAFQKRGGLRELDIEPLEEEQPAIPFELTGDAQEASPLYDALLSRGISKKSAAVLLERFPAEVITHKIDVFDFLDARKDKCLQKSPSGYLYTSIIDGFADPKGFVNRAERTRQAEAVRQAQSQALETRRLTQAEAARQRETTAKIDAFRATCSVEKLAQLEVNAIAQASEETRRSLDEPSMQKFRQTRLLLLTNEYIGRLIQAESKQPEPA